MKYTKRGSPQRDCPLAVNNSKKFERGWSRPQGGLPAGSIFMNYIYLLQSIKDGKTYAGYSCDVSRRLKEHNEGKVKSTKHRRPLKLLFTEKFKTEKEAKKRELYWKSGAGRRKLKEYFDKLR